MFPNFKMLPEIPEGMMFFFLQLVMEYCLGSASDLLEGKFNISLILFLPVPPT